MQLRRVIQLLGIAILAPALVHAGGATPASLAQRVADHRAVQEINWAHRTWPAENPSPKPSMAEVTSAAQLEAEVLDGLRKVAALESVFGRRIEPGDVQREIDRIVRSTKMPERLREIWQALDGSADRFGEEIARPLLADRLLRAYVRGRGWDFDTWWSQRSPAIAPTLPAPLTGMSARQIDTAVCAAGTWSPMLRDFPAPSQYPLAVWTGTEVLLWGDGPVAHRYDPATDSWTAMSNAGMPAPQYGAAALWTGTEMLLVGVATSTVFPPNYFYNPATNTWRTASAPSGQNARWYASVVWTGSSVFIWGGQDQATSAAVNTGLRYDLATDQWSSISTTGAPTARIEHGAVWTGSLMVVWGGRFLDGTDFTTNTGGRYNPATNSWTTTKLSGAPLGRSDMTTVWTGSKMIVWAGRGTDDQGSDEFNDGARYDPVADSWTHMATAGAPTARYAAPAIWTGSEMIVWSGSSYSTSFAAGGGRYKESTNKWDPVADTGSPGDRVGHSMVWTGIEAIVWGGQDGTNTVDTGARYNAATNSWAPTHPTNRPLPRAQPASVWTGNELLTWGGTLSGTPATGAGSRYDPTFDAWTPISQVNEPSGARFSHTAVWTGTAMIVWGGFDVIEGGPLGDGGRYTMATNSWTQIPASPALSARGRHRAAWTAQSMLVWGGASSPGSSGTYFGDGARFDPATASWTPMSAAGAPAPRADHGAVWTGAELISWGGNDGSQALTNGARYRATSDSWTPATPNGLIQPASYGTNAIWNGHEMIVPGAGAYAGWVFDPTGGGSWRSMTVAGAPGSGETGTRGAGWSCDRMYSIGSMTNVNASYDPRRNTWSPVAKNPSEMVFYSSGDVVGAGSRVLAWNGTSGEVYCACAEPQPAAPQVFLYWGDPSQDDHIDWMVTSAAATYDLVRGNLATLRSTGGDFAAATQSCLANDTSDVAWVDSDPVPASGYWYLARGRLGATTGSYDSGAPRQAGSRDAEIGASPAACP